MPKAIGWLEALFDDNQEILALIGNMDMNWEKIVNSVIAFFKSGAGSVLNSTMSAAKKYCEQRDDILYFFRVCVLYSASKRRNCMVR